MGLGLASFLNHNEGSARKFLKDWKKKGSIVVWLYTRADIAWASWNHSFVAYGTYKNDKDEEVECLKYPRFVSPDPEVVHQNQYFRNEGDDSMQIPPSLDPFLRLREWLRLDCDLPLDTVIFRWENPHPKPGKSPIIEWQRGHLARLVDRGRYNFGASLDTKLEYFFVVVDNEKPQDGAQIVRGTKLLGDVMKKEIGHQIESDGEKGNPLIHPYAFKWVYDDSAGSPMDSYRAFRYNAAELTPQIREAITSSEYPDPSQDCKPRAGDKAKIRAAMEAAAQVDLPWDRLFVPEWEDEEPGDFNYGANAGSQVVSQGSGTSGGATGRPASQTGSQGPSRERESHAVSGAQSARRKKVNKPEPPPPNVEMIKCDDCDTMLRPDQAKCPNCGAEYEVDSEPTVSSNSVQQETRVSNGTTGTTGTTDVTCWSCGGPVVKGSCTNCGLEAGDEIPF
jgi:hypothetical protein